jgi:hypothetical protein
MRIKKTTVNKNITICKAATLTFALAASPKISKSSETLAIIKNTINKWEKK